MINLFPWREQQLYYHRKVRKYVLVGAVIFNILLFGSIHALLLSELKNMQRVNVRLQHQLEKAQQKKSALELSNAANALVQNIFASQRTTEIFFRKLDSDMQEVCFTAINKLNHIFSFSGIASSSFDFMTFLRHWPMAVLFSEIQIEQLQYEAEAVHFKFKALADDSAQEVKAVKNESY